MDDILTRRDLKINMLVGLTWLENFDFHSKVTISVSHLDGVPWCLSFFGVYINLFSERGWAVWTTGV